MASVVLKNIQKRWGDTQALSDINLYIESGSFCVLLGPSGCGKSTTLRIIAGLEASTSGTIEIDGQPVTHMPPAQRGIAMVFQNYALFPHLSVAQNIVFGLKVRKLPASEQAARLHEVAALLGLSHLLERKPGQLSGGQQQRVALGRALVAQAKVCLMDEPLSNLDARLRQDMRRELRELQRKLGLTVIYVTHDQTEAMSMADQVVLLNHGHVEQAAPAHELYARPATTFVARFVGTPPMNLLQLEPVNAAGHSPGLPAGATPVRITGTDLTLALPAQAAQLGVRPEAVTLHPAHTPGTVPATVAGTEYLGADLVLHCTLGAQSLLVRADGRLRDLHTTRPGTVVGLGWAVQDLHAFDSQGARLPLAHTA